VHNSDSAYVWTTELNRLITTRWGRWGLFVIGWTVLSLLFAPETYFFFLYRNEAIPWSRTIALTLANAGIVLLFLPAIFWLARRYPIEQRTWPKAILIHIPACLFFSLSHSWLYAALCYASPEMFHRLFVRFHPNLLTYWAILGFAQAGDYFRRYKERERQLAQAELHLLRAQLQPHFLFNCLHTISAMMHEDVDDADRMVNRVSELLRVVLDSIGKHELPMSEEVKLLEAYVEIERIRFQERLELRVQLDACTENALVPSMILQPLAENSVHHGFPRGKKAGIIQLRAERRDDRLVITLVDNGIGFDVANRREGLGLSNARRRLVQLYPNSHDFEIGNSPGGGTSVVISIPYHTDASVAESGVIAELVSDENSGVDRGRRALGAEADRYAAQS
jgi:two-component system LytT family sensor kinase